MADEKPNPNKTVFQPSPLQQRAAAQPPAAPPPPPPQAPTEAAPPPLPSPAAPVPAPMPAAPPRPPLRDDIPRPPIDPTHRNPLMAKAAPLLALLASIRSGRAQVALPDLHRRAAADIANFQAEFQGRLNDEHLRRAVYALAATADDIALNLPLPQSETAQWAQRSLVARQFQEAIGGDRFWRLLDEMIARPTEFQHLLELYHACMAAGFEGRYRVMSDGRHAHQALMQRVYQALDLSRTLSNTELAPHWQGEDAPAGKVGLWGPLAVAASLAVGLLLVIYIGLYVWLQWNGQQAKDALLAINGKPSLTMNRQATPPPVDRTVAETVRTFLAQEIRDQLVEVNPTASGVQIVTTDKTLAFDPGSEQITAQRRGLFEKIATALNTEAGAIRVEGFTDSQPYGGAKFHDNTELSQARADTVRDLIRSRLTDQTRPVTSKGFGEMRPKDVNTTPLGRARNRRVEIYLDRGGQ